MCRVISVTVDSSSSYSSCSPTSETCSRNSARPASGSRAAAPSPRRELLDVLDAPLRLDRAIGLELDEVARLLRGELHHAGRARPLVVVRLQRGHHLVEAGDRALRACVEHGDLVDTAAGLDDVDALGGGVGLERRHGRVADAPLGHVHDTPERDHVLRVERQPQVAEHVLDLPALIEANAAEDPVGRAHAHEDVLDDTGHRVRPVEDRHIPIPVALVVAQALDLRGDEHRLLVLVVAAERGSTSSPGAASVHSSLGLRWALCSITALAAARMLPVER